MWQFRGAVRARVGVNGRVKAKILALSCFAEGPTVLMRQHYELIVGDDLQEGRLP